MAENFVCAICLDFASELPDKDYLVTTKGGHIFHYFCIKQYLANSINGDDETCPLCREPIILKELTRLYGIKLKRSTVSLRLQSDGSDGTFPSIKIVILGNSSVGKTSILRRLANQEFIPDLSTTCGCDVVFRNISVGGKVFRLNIWDTAGQENFRSVVSTTVRGAMGIILTYDITDAISVNDIEGWLRFANDYSPEDSTKIIVGNKLDLSKDRKVAYFVGQAIAEKLNAPFFEVSAKTGENVEIVFRALVCKILEKPTLSTTSTNVIELDVERPKPHKQCPCSS